MAKIHKRILIAAVILIGVISIGGLFAKYRTEQNKEAEMIAADFHFSADYLEESKTLTGEAQTVYAVSDWTEGITLELYNYEKENTAQISELEIEYEVTVDNDQFKVVYDNQEQKLKEEEMDSDIVKIQLIDNAEVMKNEITISIKTSPYNEGLTAKFELVGEQYPEVTVSNEGTHYIAKIYSNQYKGKVNLEWTKELIPDRTNDFVDDTWKDGSGSFEVEPFHTYEIIFFNPENKNDGITITPGTVRR